MDNVEEEENKKVVYDAIIVGGGLSGLAAARRLSRAGVQNVLVLEARDRVGGRTETSLCRPCDLGAGYVGPTQDCILRVAQEYGIQTYPVYTKGKMLFRKTTTATTTDDNDEEDIVRGSVDFPPIGLYGLLDFNSILVRMEDLAKQVDLNNPAAALTNAQELDNLSVFDWIQQHSTSAQVRRMFPRVVDSILFRSSKEISMLYFLWYARSGDTLKRLMDISNGAQEQKFVGGSNLISQKMAEELGSHSVKLNSAVETIDQTTKDGTLVSVTCRDGSVYRAKKVIVALAPPLYKMISWKPALPSTKVNIQDSLSMGFIVKTFLYYETAWWRELGLNGQIWDVNGGPVLYSIDDCKADTSNPCLMGFVVANDAIAWSRKSREERKTAIVQQYRAFFKSDKAENPIDYQERDWNKEEFSGGGPVASPKLGTFLETSKNIRTPVKNVHFAGTELATVWAGYMDGAISSGDRAANEVAALLCESVLPDELLLPSTATSTSPGIFERFLAWAFDLYRSWFE